MSNRAKFESEIYEAVAQLPQMFGNAHGDRVVTVAMMNPAAELASPKVVIETVRKASLSPGELWTMFKDAGGVSKAGGGPDESEQLEPLKRVWKRLGSAPVDSAPGK